MKKFIIPLICTTFLLGGCPVKHEKHSYIDDHLLSMKGEEDSQADILTRTIVSVMTTDDESYHYEERLAEAKTVCGEKSLFVFASHNCSSCGVLLNALSELEKSYESKYYVHVIDIEEDDNAAFKSYVERNSAFFELAAEAGYKSAPYTNGYFNTEVLDPIGSCDLDNMVVPMVFMIDFTDDSWQKGIRDIIVGIPGGEGLLQSLLINCIDGTWIFEK